MLKLGKPVKNDHKYEGFIQWETLSLALRNLEKFLLFNDKTVDINYRIQAERILGDHVSKPILLKIADDDQQTIKEFAKATGVDSGDFKDGDESLNKYRAQVANMRAQTTEPKKEEETEGNEEEETEDKE